MNAPALIRYILMQFREQKPTAKYDDIGFLLEAIQLERSSVCVAVVFCSFFIHELYELLRKKKTNEAVYMPVAH